MSWTVVLLIVLIVLLLGSTPATGWGARANWGWGPSGLLFVVLVILCVLILTGRFPRI